MEFGKHALFIWASYGVAMASLLCLALASRMRMRALEATAEAMKRDRRG
jgi:heme exporter protein CcmD